MAEPSCVVVCIKWSAPTSPDDSAPDERFAGMSLADRAALELALRTGESTGDDVVALTVGPTGADKILREALASGATRAVRVDSPDDAPTMTCAAAAAQVCASLRDIRIIWCGDYSPDRGSGSFPAFLAAHLDLEQCLGLVRVEFPATGVFPLEVVRRLDGGRRERAIVGSTALLSVEGSLATLRRASLSRTLSSQSMPIDVIASDLVSHDLTVGEVPVLRPFSPRARTIPAPVGASPLDRIRAVTEASGPKGTSDPVVLEPGRAAESIIGHLREWGYVE